MAELYLDFTGYIYRIRIYRNFIGNLQDCYFLHLHKSQEIGFEITQFLHNYGRGLWFLGGGLHTMALHNPGRGFLR